jgi:hypothetical protein
MPNQPTKLEQLASQIKDLSETLAREKASELSGHRAKQARIIIGEAYEKLRKVVEDLDPIRQPGFVFDLSNPSVVGRIVGITMIAQPRKSLASIERCYGSGVTTAATFPLTPASRKRSIRFMWERSIRPLKP